MPKTTTKAKTEKKSAPEAQTVAEKKPALQEYFYGCGKRKTSIARVRLYPKGKGLVTVNNRPMQEYFTMSTSAGTIMAPLKLTSLAKDFDISALIKGGGVNSQAEALRHGIARALLVYNDTLRGTLKKAGFLTRDARIKERKKPGLKRARRAPQFSKR